MILIVNKNNFTEKMTAFSLVNFKFKITKINKACLYKRSIAFTSSLVDNFNFIVTLIIFIVNLYKRKAPLRELLIFL